MDATVKRSWKKGGERKIWRKKEASEGGKRRGGAQ